MGNEDEIIEAMFGLGRYLGYPDCCIREFWDFEKLASNAYKQALFTDERQVAQSHPRIYLSGYIPCNACFRAYTDEELVERIEQNRKHPEPFPQYEHPRYESPGERW